jgi:uncharacterized membrane protein
MLNWRLAVGVLAVAAYALLSHVLMLYAADRPWAVLAIFAPLLLAVFAFALQRRHLPTLLATLAAFAVLGVLVARGGLGEVNRLYVAQHAGVHLVLCATFAATLRRGGLSLIGRLATQVHGSITPAMRDYTFRITRMWACYFFGMATLSVWIYLNCAWSTWSLFGNLLTPVSAVALFIGEYLVRYALHPEFERATLSDALRAYARSGAPASGPGAR